MLAPVVLFVYNRPEHTQRLLETLERNQQVEASELYIFSDAERGIKEADSVAEVRRKLEEYVPKSGFKKVHIEYAEKNRGLAASVISGVTKVIEEYGRAIVLEDDLLVSKDFLQYMNEALDFYCNEKDIWSISGYSFPMKVLRKYSHDIFYSYRGCSWGWATWKDRWETTDWNVSKYTDLLNDQKLQKKFNRGGNDLTVMLKNQMEGKLDSWAIRWCFSQSLAGKYTIYPKYSRVINEGCDGSGTHSGISNEYSTKFEDSIIACKFERLSIDRRIAREFKHKYSDTILKKIKRRIISR